jgi:hypothetical protein
MGSFHATNACNHDVALYFLTLHKPLILLKNPSLVFVVYATQSGRRVGGA